jgi:hypothetical protein
LGGILKNNIGGMEARSQEARIKIKENKKETRIKKSRIKKKYWLLIPDS